MSRQIPMCLATISVSLMFVFCGSVWTQETKKANPRIKELQRKRLAVLEEIERTARSLYTHARVPLDELQSAERELLWARLTYAETQAERIKYCDDAIQEATKTVGLATAKTASAQGTIVSVLKAQSFLIEAQIQREIAEAGE